MSKNRLAFVTAGLLLCSLFSDNASASRTVVLPGSPFIVDVWGIEDGLPQSSVISIAQAHDGYLWLGTLNGLCRFDGMKFTLFDEANTPGLNSSRVVHLFEDSQGDLWVGTENAGISLIKKNGEVRSFDLGRGARNGRLISACEDAEGTIWLLTRDGLLGSYQNEKLIVGLVGCKMVVAEKGGPLLLATDEGLFARQSAVGAAAAFVQVAPTTSQMDFLFASPTGGYWRFADRRIEKWKGTRRERSLGDYPWGGTPVSAACEDREGNLIVGTYGNGIYWFDADGKYVHLIAELSHSSVLSVLIDREGNLWVGTNGGGLNRIKRKMFGVFPGSEGRVVQSACIDNQDGLWVGYNGESRVDYRRHGISQTNRMVAIPNIAEDCHVKSVFVDKDQRVWSGIWFIGDPLQLSSRLFEYQSGNFQAEEGIKQDVSAIYQDRAGVLWLGLQGGLARREGTNWSFYSTRDGLPGNEVRAICEDGETNLWIATGSGLARLRNGQFTAFYKRDGLPSEDLSCLYPDSKGVLWIGTRGSGLVRFSKGKWTVFTTRDGLIGNSIGYIFEDTQTNLWIGSNAGLLRVAKKSLNDRADRGVGQIVCRAYVESDGLPTRECTQGSQPAACRSSDGTLWFPTTKGLVSVNPSALIQNPYHPPVIIESIRVEGVEQITNRLRTVPLPAIVVPPGKQHLEIHYTSLNLGAADQSRFRYQLEGHEKSWNEVGDARVARYSRLPPGDYTFRVAAANEDGVWNPIASTQIIQLQPPFWRTTWFISLISLCVLGLIVGIVYYFSTQELQRELVVLKQHEELEKERARIARDLHDQLGANLMQVALLGDLAETDKDLPNEVEEHAKQISQTARETTKALDEIVWAVNPSNDTLDGLVNYICKYAQEYFEIAGLRYRIEVPAELPKIIIPPEVRHNVFLAAKEAVNNVVKHAHATSAWLRLQMEPNHFTLEIQDDGHGVKGLNDKTGRNGLRNMHKRLEDVGGIFSIGPAPEKGAMVRFTVPINSR
jgi:ligand-binding sensor domain-containing protein/signal transduction histidine kinase